MFVLVPELIRTDLRLPLVQNQQSCTELALSPRTSSTLSHIWLTMKKHFAGLQFNIAVWPGEWINKHQDEYSWCREQAVINIFVLNRNYIYTCDISQCCFCSLLYVPVTTFAPLSFEPSLTSKTLFKSCRFWIFWPEIFHCCSFLYGS